MFDSQTAAPPSGNMVSHQEEQEQVSYYDPYHATSDDE